MNIAPEYDVIELLTTDRPLEVFNMFSMGNGDGSGSGGSVPNGSGGGGGVPNGSGGGGGVPSGTSREDELSLRLATIAYEHFRSDYEHQVRFYAEQVRFANDGTEMDSETQAILDDIRLTRDQARSRMIESSRILTRLQAEINQTRGR